MSTAIEHSPRLEKAPIGLAVTAPSTILRIVNSPKHQSGGDTEKAKMIYSRV